MQFTKLKIITRHLVDRRKSLNFGLRYFSWIFQGPTSADVNKQVFISLSREFPHRFSLPFSFIMRLLTHVSSLSCVSVPQNDSSTTLPPSVSRKASVRPVMVLIRRRVWSEDEACLRPNAKQGRICKNILFSAPEIEILARSFPDLPLFKTLLQLAHQSLLVKISFLASHLKPD